ncbi:hypothetical protein AB0L63_05035 [Nocardia sp. NPDC051990]|uniref:hypothetical protein n=1 Tax=Nocardia sp. NPDC051990 TaxID=3155285 RepID=UPI00341FF5B0
MTAARVGYCGAGQPSSVSSMLITPTSWLWLWNIERGFLDRAGGEQFVGGTSHHKSALVMAIHQLQE